MPLKMPSELFLDWLALRPHDTRVAVVVDPDRFLADAKLFGKSGVVDTAGRDWQLAVFRGDDLAFRLSFRTAISKGRTAIILTRGADTDKPIDVSFVADILAKNEAGPPLDLSVPAFFRHITPKINCPVRELRRFKHDLLARLDQAQGAAEKLIQRWGKPDSWGRGQVAAMVLLAYQPELTLTDIWPDETGSAEFLAHVVRLLVAMPQLRPQREIVLQVIREAAREQVHDVMFWADAEPEELAGYLVLRDLAAQAKLQNPATQLSGLQVFSPELPLGRMEPLALKVIESLKKQDKTWGMVGQGAEAFLTPRRAAKVADLLLPAPGSGNDIPALVGLEIPAILRQQVISTLDGFFAQPPLAFLTRVASLANHPLLLDKELLTERARQCRAGLRFLLGVQQIEQRLSVPVPEFPHADALLDWYIHQGNHLLELDVSRAGHTLAHLDDDTVAQQGQQYLFGSDEQRPSPESLKGRIVARLEQLNRTLATFVRQDPEGFGRGARSIRGFLRSRIPVDQIAADTLPGRVWVLVFDGMRLDTWEAIVRPLLAEVFKVEDTPYFCLLPSYTSVARTGLLAGGLPREWKGFKGHASQDEAQLFAVNMGLTPQEVKSKLRFVTGADTTKARKKMGSTDKDAALLNVLIYPISDDDAHAFEGDLASFNNTIRSKIVGDKQEGVRGILDDLLKRIGPDDVAVLASDHGFAELLHGDAVTVAESEAKRAGKTLECVGWRYVEGFEPSAMPEAVKVPGVGESVWLAVGRRWCVREGTKAVPRYSHGGLSLAEMVVPGVVLRRVTEKTARVELLDLPPVLVLDEDAEVPMVFSVRNTGNVEVEYEVRVANSLGEELLERRGGLAQATSASVTAMVQAKYRETVTREPDLTRTLTGVTVRLRHTDLEGNWRDALDGVITIPVKITPKPVKFDTDALKGFDDVERGFMTEQRALNDLDKKIEAVLGDRVILKPLTRWNEAYKEFPRYVMEYLVSRYVEAGNPVDGQRKIDRILSEHYTESAKKELIKSRIKERGQYTLLGQLSVRLDQSRDHYWANVPALGDDTVRVAPTVLAQYGEALLTSGAWGTMEIEYDGTYEIKGRKFPFYIHDFTPLQYTRLNLDDFVQKRAEFTADEWLDLLVQSIGFNPAKFDRRVKMLMLLRLVPFVESNYNMIELGPRETGKTYTFRNTSNRAFVVSGGKATPATLFYNKATRKLGVIGLKHLVFFDEIANTNFDDAEASISVLKDYMQTGKFSRGDQEFSAQCSIVLGGNIETNLDRREPDPRYRHLFEVLPLELQDPAFLDRIHAYLPGWEMPKIRPENYAEGYGLLTDYMAEIFAELRRRNFQTHVSARVNMGGMTGRNQDAIKKTTAGLLKLLHPHVTPDTLTMKEIGSLVEMATEMRQRVTDQLAKMLPAEFGSTNFAYQLVS